MTDTNTLRRKLFKEGKNTSQVTMTETSGFVMTETSDSAITKTPTAVSHVRRTSERKKNLRHFWTL